MNKKILIVSEVFYPESTMLNDFVQELVEYGFQVEVLTQHPSYPFGKIYNGYVNTDYVIEEWNNIKIHRFKLIEGYKESKLKKILNYWTFVNKGSKIAREIGSDFDEIFVYQTGPLTVALPAVSIKKKFKTRMTIWTFDIWPDAVYAYGFPAVYPLRKFLSYIIKRVYSNADNILISSMMFKNTILEYVPNKVIQYAPNWLINEVHTESNIVMNNELINFTFTGNISKAQNLENVILGWRHANIADKAVLNIIGDGSSLDSLKDLVLKHSVKGVIFHGRYPSNQMQSVMSKSDTLILSLISDIGISKTEPFKLQSYLQSGKPIFGVIKGAGKEIIEANHLGICSDPDDISDIANGFILSIDFAQTNKQQVIQSSKILLKERFNRRNTVDKILCLFKQ